MAYGRIGELNFSTYIFSYLVSTYAFFLRVVLGLGVAASTVYSEDAATFGGLPLRFLGGSAVFGLSLEVANCLCGYPKIPDGIK